jgi:DNA-directed RNA polymerase
VGRGKTKTVVLNKKLNQTNTRAQTQAIIPNIIHSMDSSHLILILNKIINKNNSNNPIIYIYDCFGCLPNNMIDLENLVKLEFINLYSKNDFLEKFNDDLFNLLNKNKIYYEINKTEHKVYVYLDKSINYNNPMITSNKTKKLEPISFYSHPKLVN